MDRVDECVESSTPRHRRVRAHAAGVRARVAVADALEVLRRAERRRRGARRRVRRATPRRPRAAPRSPRRSPERLRRPAARRRARSACGRRRRPCPAASPSALTTHGARATTASRRSARRPPAARPWRTPSSLRSAPPRRSARTRRCPLRRSCVGDAGDERRLRADHGEVDLERHARARAGRRRRRRAPDGTPERRDARVAGRRVQLGRAAGSARAATRAHARARPSRRPARFTRRVYSCSAFTARSTLDVLGRQRCSSGSSLLAPRRHDQVITRGRRSPGTKIESATIDLASSQLAVSSEHADVTRARARAPRPTPTSSIGTPRPARRTRRSRARRRQLVERGRHRRATRPSPAASPRPARRGGSRDWCAGKSRVSRAVAQPVARRRPGAPSNAREDVELRQRQGGHPVHRTA